MHHHPTHGRPDPLALKPDPARAADACRALIRAYVLDPSHVDWSDVQVALDRALAAFNLPADYVETEGGRFL
ncbi:hypothetical protein IPS27_20695 [Xanthomonas perforans]|uniref:hypothetical protein n=1 Tax=Xanthomonas TaxID=338 RepID=UPI000A6B4EED|nr:hypothetical protein [Xanthomonas perforans]MBZ2461372.1 hypothetical protein [Xanthomonas perforans]MBZ2482798.1 hypothetical protein [Xanthomonas perforans]MBZ2491366.1 hypothetical protein [Xanthomonas perforans]MBZ2495745.1 hypothetical protein [Xanthomonas perforans]MBZ2513254.1 hypothetical protein [Xanthomonas perforans]